MNEERAVKVWWKNSQKDEKISLRDPCVRSLREPKVYWVGQYNGLIAKNSGIKSMEYGRNIR